ncbi:hypothetical protein H0H81_008378 [Sphagnurus paluster]|uniref:Cytochrome P450 n=1 Tax=Sphagnurus paluster TaxID=117069 RepID=A0A9P7GN15_9AGAR|nr:hypothetical protein H0H81_008378 [Sphagnurus paluster]
MEIAITKDLLDGPREINILRWMTRAALEMIGQSGLGYSFDPLVDEESENPFTKSVEQLFPTLLKFRFAQEFLLTTAVKIGTPRFRRAVLDLIPLKSLRKLLGIIDVLENTAKEILDGKKEALEKGDEAVKEQVGQGKDIISILCKWQDHSLVFGAMDTTSTALSRALSTLAKYPETQDKLREEIQEARKRYGEIPHDELMALPYLDAICREIMRL